MRLTGTTDPTPDDDPLAPAAREAVERVHRLAYSPAELAAALGCSRQHVQNQIASGELPSFKFGRKRLIARTVVDELVAGNDA